MDTILSTPQLVVEDRERNLFRVSRRAFTEEAVLEAERRAIFDRCWLYLGHASEIPDNCDYITRAVGGRELIFNRDRAGVVHAFLNTCPHRGAMVVRERKGNALSFRCFYHGWSFNVNGRFASRFEEGNYGKEHYGGGCADLAEVPRLESYRDFWFVNFDRNAVSLSDYLAGAKEYIDMVADQAETMEIVGSGQQYVINANWKLLAENSIDAFHGFPVHNTYFDYLKNIGSLRMDTSAGHFAARGMTDLGNGHAVIEYQSPWGRPIARWVPSWGEEKRPLVERLRQGLIQRFGEERGHRMAEFSRNMLIFPNLVINDIMAITVRTFMPDCAGQDDGERLGARRARRGRRAAQAAPVQLPRVPGAGRLRHARRPGGAGELPARLQEPARGRLERHLQGHAAQGPAHERRRGADALLLAAMARARGRRPA